jgi:GNAT superfamily N-acetyltransferase
VIRPPAPGELARLQEIEVAAGQAFADVGMAEIAAADPPSLATLERYRAADRTWVVTVGDAVAGYILMDLVDGDAHVEQVSVDPRFRGRRLGGLLLDHVAAVARERGLGAVTLTTFRDVPWNEPYYARCGFRTLAEDELGPGLRALRATEAAHGLDPDQRVCMWRAL